MVVRAPAGRGRRGRTEYDFLPAALEITEPPASPASRAVAGTSIAFFCVAVGWAFWGKVDIVTSATGKIIPTGRTKTIQPLEIGVVRAIHVQDGQSVQAGDVLIELDPTTSTAERDHLTSDLVAVQLDVARLRAALSDSPDALVAFIPPAGATPSLIVLHRQFLLNQTAEQGAKLAALDRQQAQREAERTTVAAAIGKIEAALPLVPQRPDVQKNLYDPESDSKIH